jgi:hypothetical protein
LAKNEIMTATAFVLVVLVAGSPAYARGTFPDFQRCIEAGIGEVETLRAIEPTVQWQCLAASPTR